MSRFPSRLKYASAFSPPNVSCRMFDRCRSPGAGAEPLVPVEGAVAVTELSAAGTRSTRPHARAAVTIVTAAIGSDFMPWNLRLLGLARSGTQRLTGHREQF